MSACYPLPSALWTCIEASRSALASPHFLRPNLHLVQHVPNLPKAQALSPNTASDDVVQPPPTPNQARRWQISMGGPSPPNSPKSPLFVRVPPITQCTRPPTHSLRFPSRLPLIAFPFQPTVLLMSPGRLCSISLRAPAHPVYPATVSLLQVYRPIHHDSLQLSVRHLHYDIFFSESNLST